MKGVDVKEFHNFYTRYQNKMKLKDNTALSMSLRLAPSNQEKPAIDSKRLRVSIIDKDH